MSVDSCCESVQAREDAAEFDNKEGVKMEEDEQTRLVFRWLEQAADEAAVKLDWSIWLAEQGLEPFISREIQLRPLTTATSTAPC